MVGADWGLLALAMCWVPSACGQGWHGVPSVMSARFVYKRYSSTVRICYPREQVKFSSSGACMRRGDCNPAGTCSNASTSSARPLLQDRDDAGRSGDPAIGSRRNGRRRGGGRRKPHEGEKSSYRTLCWAAHSTCEVLGDPVLLSEPGLCIGQPSTNGRIALGLPYHAPARLRPPARNTSLRRRVSPAPEATAFGVWCEALHCALVAALPSTSVSPFWVEPEKTDVLAAG